MSLLATLALAASGATLPVCSWDRPGVNPFMGDVVAAVDRYKDIPADTRAKLKARMAKRDYDEIVSIRRDGIGGKAQYGGDIRDMYFGSGSVCTTVTRSKWTDAMEERGLVYCEDGQCILVPTVCRNVSRITRIAPRPAAAVSPGAAAAPPETELEMDPTSAGPLADGAPGAAPTSFAQLANPTVDSGLPPLTGSPTGATPPSFGPPVPPSLPPGLPPVLNPPQGPTPPDVPGPPLPAVPEPSTWAMLLGGVAVLAFLSRRRIGARV